MTYTIRDDHIGIFDNFYSNDLIEKYIDYFEFYSKNFRTYFRNTPDICDENIDTITTNFHENLDVKVNYLNKQFLDIFFGDIYPLYVKRFQILNSIRKVSVYDIKIQKTKPGQGYHIWHCENSDPISRNRVCAFMMYLNDIEEGGETEFLYQKFKMKPQKNRLLIWPAYFTHTHRGNPPLSGDKYIITGWVEYG